MVHQYFLKNLGTEARVRHWPVILHAILNEAGFLQKEETWADLKSEGKEPSVSDTLIIDVIAVIKRSRVGGKGHHSDPDLLIDITYSNGSAHHGWELGR